MIRLTLFYCFSFAAVISVLLLFFTKDTIKTVLALFGTFLSASFICLIFRHFIPAVILLFIAFFFPALFCYISVNLKKGTVSAKGITPVFFKFFSAFFCIGIFFVIMLAAAGLRGIQYSDVRDPVRAEDPVKNKKQDYGVYFSSLAALALFSIIPGRKILIYEEEEDA
ncbi:MAG: hypothetical protein K5838_01715 [Elusimicrobiales bacterium]|nr:hypothetical protein [Elusimicrobiales bacterium]